tara:strand:+ start:541 stop:807 length:267 start_codon:yes stop_codon:yes gene_type:complete
MLSHFKNYTICSGCEDKIKVARDKYKQNSEYYIKKQKEYRDNLDDQYVSRVVADNTILKPSEIPKEIVQAKRQHMQLNKLIKEEKDGG